MNCIDKPGPLRKSSRSRNKLIRIISIKDKFEEESDECYKKRILEGQQKVHKFLKVTENLNKEESKFLSTKSVKKRLNKRKLKFIAERIDLCVCGPTSMEIWELDEDIDPEGGKETAETEVEEEGLRGIASYNVGFDMNIGIDEQDAFKDAINLKCCHPTLLTHPGFFNPDRNRVKVAVIDGGIDFVSHPRLVELMWQPSILDIIGRCDISTNYNLGYDFTGSGNVVDEFGHGTHLAGIISGFCRSHSRPQVGFPHDKVKLELMNLKIGKKGFSLSAAVCAIHFAINMKADVINLSWGFYTSKKDEFEFHYHPLKAAIRRASENGIIVCTSAGNAGRDLDIDRKSKCFHYPSEYARIQKNSPKNILSIGSVGRNADDQKIAKHSNFGLKAISIFSPGNCVESLKVNGGTIIISGTSMATAQASRGYAIVKAINNSPSANQTLAHIESKKKQINDQTSTGNYLPEEVDNII